MATEIATAYVSLIPSTSKIAPGARTALGEVERDAARTGSRMGSSLATGISTGVAAVTSLLGGLALKGGFTRALAIDNAQAKMKALGYSTTQVQDVMNSALVSVKGTAFGLGDAASLATQLIAGGIKPGQDLARALGNTADLAAVANVSLGDLSPVMGQLASSSHLYTQDLLQLQQRGLPVFSWLADSLGKTQSEVRDMVSSGDVSFAQLQTAIETHIGGAAKATDSFKASWSNVLAALSRTGAVVATPALGMLKGIFDQAIPAIDAVSAKITPLVATLTDKFAPIVSDVAARISKWVQSTGGLTSSFSGLSSILLPLGGAIAAIGGGGLASAIPGIGKMLPAISGPMGLLLGTIAALVTQSPELKTALGDAFFSLGGALQNLAPLFPVLVDVATSLANTLGGALATVISTAVVPLIQMLANTVLPALLPVIVAVLGLVTDLAYRFGGQLATAIAAIAPMLLSLATAILPPIISALAATAQWMTQNADLTSSLAVALLAGAVALKAFMVIKSLITAFTAWGGIVRVGIAIQTAWNAVLAANPIGIIIVAVAALVAGLVYFFTQTALGHQVWASFVTFLGTAWAWLQAAAAATWAAIQAATAPVVAWFQTYVAPLFSALGDLVAAVFSRIGQVVSFFWTNVWQPVINLILAYWKFLWGMVQAAWDLIGPPLLATISGAWNVLSAVLSGIWNTLAAVFSGVWNALVIIVQTVLGVITGIIRAITAVIRGDWSGAWDAIKGVFVTIWSGITQSAQNAVNTLASIISSIKDTVLNVFSAAGDWLKDVGRKIIDGLVNGIKSGFEAVKNLLGNLTDLLPDWKGPAAVDAKLLTGNGRLIMQSLVSGFQDEAPSVRKYLAGFTTDLAATGTANVNISGSAGAGNGVATGPTSLNRADLDYLAAQVGTRVVAGAQIVSGDALAGASRSSDNTRSTQGRVH